MGKRKYPKRTNCEDKNQKLHVNSARFVAQSHDLSNSNCTQTQSVIVYYYSIFKNQSSLALGI